MELELQNFWIVGNLVMRDMWWHDIDYFWFLYIFFILWSLISYVSCFMVSLVMAHVSHGSSSYLILVCEDIYWYIYLKSFNMLWRLWWCFSWHISWCDIDIDLYNYLGCCWHRSWCLSWLLYKCNIEWEVDM